jgi:clan AA aspartic protease (TIGR02281 family)
MKLPIGIPLIIKNVTIDGPKGPVNIDMILDTGATLTVISPTVIESIGYDLATLKHQRIRLPSGHIYEVPKLLVDQIAIGNIMANNVEVVCLDKPAVNGINGLLGLSFLQHFRTVIDYKQGYLEIS